MMKGLVWALFVLSATAAADTISTRPPVELNVTSGLEPVCFYEDRRYSRGSVIEMGKQLFVCEREKSFEQHGRLSWHPFPLESNDQR
ncbi:DUF1496 domain-containing protein [Oceanisphaera psychrotolerans]|uniref:DUF1496 domain-containing protein n=1 Tax=Oceanisphaera psychrotolerans TaxID=1414654 RepID=A0A1J4QBN0_9GAMM|nr:DUF1496 domain-containing protein [Oceanisphaera psychrotolerans]OIN07286.1 hypothetical protein BFR47_16680 [Oceanisphaera psychrotolerans]